jgi:hypothetical protein
LPAPVGPRMRVWPTSPTARCSRNGVSPVVLQCTCGAPTPETLSRWPLVSSPAHTELTGIMWARFRLLTTGRRTFAYTWPGSDPAATRVQTDHAVDAGDGATGRVGAVAADVDADVQCPFGARRCAWCPTHQKALIALEACREAWHAHDERESTRSLRPARLHPLLEALGLRKVVRQTRDRHASASDARSNVSPNGAESTVTTTSEPSGKPLGRSCADTTATNGIYGNGRALARFRHGSSVSGIVGSNAASSTDACRGLA